MRLISKTKSDSVSREIGTGNIVQTVSTWTVVFLTDGGEQRIAYFDHDPTDQEIFQACKPSGTALVPTSKAALEDAMIDAYSDWRRWQATRIEAQARTAPAAIITALQNREDASWTTYVNLIGAWRTAV